MSKWSSAEPDESDLFDEAVCVAVDPEPPWVDPVEPVDVLDVVGVELDAVWVEVELDGCKSVVVLDELPVA